MPELPQQGRLRAAALVLFLVAAGSVAAQPRKPSPHFTGGALPEPPVQRRPWQPPASDLPKPLLTAAEHLFKAGLADPRGCEYRAVEVAIGSCWSGDGGILKTRAWVLPARAGDGQRFAVGWSGLVYPVVAVGARVDLRADVRAVVKADEEARAAYEKRHGPNSFYRFRQAWSEGHSLAHASLLPLRACLLLRLGEEELARRLWRAWAAGMRPNTNDDAIHLKDPYLMLATDWTWALCDRAVCAHMRGDDRLALLSLRALIPARKAVTAEARRRGFKAPEGRRGEKAPLLGFLDPAEELLADQERRARERGRGAGKADAQEKDPAKRVAAQVRGLEDLGARQWGQPGGVSLNLDRRVLALVQEGEAAVGPLLECLERDSRLTRSVQFGRDFHHHRRVLAVGEAAFEALCGILRTENFGPGVERWSVVQEGAAGRKKMAAAVRVYWEKFRGVSQDERWYRILKDDNATSYQWLEAAAAVVRTGASKPPGADELRRKANPSVSTLLAKRVAVIAGRGAPGSERVWALRDGCAMAAHLARWDRPASLPVLREQINRCRRDLAAMGQHGAETLTGHMAGLFQLRAEGGDAQAVTQYASWVCTLRPDQVGHSEREVFRPLWHYPDHPAVVKAAATLFEDPRSPWGAALCAFSRYRLDDLVRTPLLGLRGFRKPVLEALADKTPLGAVTLHEGGSQSIRADGGGTSGTGYCPIDPLAPKPGTEVRFRRCDLAGRTLAAIRGMPQVELYWLEAERDRAVADCARLLRQYGDRFREHPDVPATDDLLAYGGVFLGLPPLARPATVNDVLRGDAIFSLEGEGKARTVPLPAWPIKARWVTLKKYPFQYSWAKASGEHGTGIGYHQDGTVWQAEEAFKEGKWRRYYGFIGTGPPARVPAEEIEFPPEWGWASLSGGLDCRVEAAAPPPAENLYALGKPPAVRLKLRNRSGVERAVPALVRRGPDGPELRVGLDVEVFYLPPGIGSDLPGQPFGEPGEGWTRLKPRGSARFQSEAGTRTLRPAGECTALELDLTAWFDLSRAGSYAVRFVFPKGGAGLGEGRSNIRTFSLGAR
jgi:hypothetical protein